MNYPIIIYIIIITILLLIIINVSYKRNEKYSNINGIINSPYYNYAWYLYYPYRFWDWIKMGWIWDTPYYYDYPTNFYSVNYPDNKSYYRHNRVSYKDHRPRSPRPSSHSKHTRPHKL